ncbi:type II secretion system minor pseudopilin GspK [Variovorax sp. J22R24]|uniref:type II secretion system minor pseudopilin GspK n=1 Tax=Variovorax gracilis TaxID=3053502 RepID=UPI0025782042|nr:type II secretion system minor pseudopilin GspK [Variovorax sp. J22R24]MDM0105490.1 type II secretion system minor pseudopilin GspK [Variovorax sp. J22R24]
MPIPVGKRQLGAALLTAMLTVTLVATFAAAALWQQWRATEVEGAERARVQSGWILIGALDWSRLILREDARANAVTGGADHLAEPWAIPLAEAKLTSFLAADKNIASDALEGLPDAFLSGRIVDAQSKLNVMNLVEGGKPVTSAVEAFTKLFALLGLPAQEVPLMVSNLQKALPATVSVPATAGTTGTTGSTGATPVTPVPTTTTTTTTTMETDTSTSATGPLVPQHTAQLVWLGLSPTTTAALEPYVTVLPVGGTKLNINTASAEAIYASVPKLDLASAKRLVERRARSYFRSLADATALVQQNTAQFSEGQHSISTSYFDVHARLRLQSAWVDEHTLLQRNGIEVRIVWRERGAGATEVPPKS